MSSLRHIYRRRYYVQLSRRPYGSPGKLLAAAPYATRGLDFKGYLLLLLPLLLLLVWFLAYQKQRSGAVLLWRILLVVFDLPHIAAIYARLSDGGTIGLDTVSVSLVIGALCFFDWYLWDYHRCQGTEG
jgi:hypothetical protein